MIPRRRMPALRPATPAELTIRGILLGCAITCVFTAANIYLGLQSGLTFASSIPAAVISMGVLRACGNAGILENNIVQTVASAAGTLANVIFVLPGLVMIGWWVDFPFWESFGICAVGGILGVMYSIPLRRSLVTQSDLPYPEGVAAAEVLKAGAGSRGGPEAAESRLGLQAVLLGSIASGLTALLVGTRLLASEVARFVRIGGMSTGITINMQLALFGAGHLIGLTAGLSMLIGMVMAWGVGVPLLTLGAHGNSGGSAALAMDLWRHKIRFIAAAALAVSAIWTLLKLALPVLAGVRSAIHASRRRREGIVLNLSERDMPIGVVGIVSLVLLLPLAWLGHRFLAGGPLAAMEVPILAGGLLFIMVVGFMVAAVCGYMAGLIGASNSPVSSLGILGVLGAAGLLAVLVKPWAGHGAYPALTAFSLFLAAVVLTVATISNDNRQDLKTGQLVGATPWRQQVALIAGVIAGAAVIPPILSVLNRAYGFSGAPHAGVHALAAPQAVLISTLAKQLIDGTVAWELLGIGAGIGLILILISEWLARRGGFRLQPLAVAFGAYIPPGTMAMVIIGAIAGHLFETMAGRRAQGETLKRLGVIMASGLIVGESLVSVLLAGLVAAAKAGYLNAADTDFPLAVVGSGFAPAIPLAMIVVASSALALYGWIGRAIRR